MAFRCRCGPRAYWPIAFLPLSSFVLIKRTWPNTALPPSNARRQCLSVLGKRESLSHRKRRCRGNRDTCPTKKRCVDQSCFHHGILRTRLCTVHRCCTQGTSPRTFATRPLSTVRVVALVSFPRLSSPIALCLIKEAASQELRVVASLSTQAPLRPAVSSVRYGFDASMMLAVTIPTTATPTTTTPTFPTVAHGLREATFCPQAIRS